MRRVTTGTIAILAAAVVLGATGCSASDSTNANQDRPADNALSKLDPCAILKPEKATQAGLPAQGEPDSGIRAEPGCDYKGDEASISIHRVAEDNFDEYGGRSVWREFKRMKINGRDAAEAHTPNETDDQCMTVLSAGGGVVNVLALSRDPRKPFDACGESLKVAKLIEPDLPE